MRRVTITWPACKDFRVLERHRSTLDRTEGPEKARFEELFDAFSRAWLKYWESYVALQNQLYESLRAARDVQWLAANDPKKLSEINRLQRELFASMPRRLDYEPLGQVSQGTDSAPSKIEELDAALSSEDAACKDLEKAIAVLKTHTNAMREAFNASRS